MKMMMYGIEEKLSFELRNSKNNDHQIRQTPLKNLMLRYFTSRGIALMALLTVSLLFLPLVLPPLPPPPLLLLLIPVAIMGVLVFLAFTPPQPPNVAFHSV